MSDIPQKMHVLSVDAKDQFNYKELPVPEPEADEVLVKVKACGICGSDIPRVLSGGVHAYPQIVGHEFSGDVVKLGSAVKDAKVGQRVTVAPLVPCGHCAACQEGHPAMCSHYSFIGSRRQGAMAEYVAVPAQNLVPIGASVSYEEAATIEPLTVAIHGVERAGAIDLGKSAIVYGLGTIGMMTLQVLLAKGLERVYAIDIDPHKLAIAKELGAYESIDSTKTNVVDYFKEHGLVDYVFETAGVRFLQSECWELAKKRGTIVYIGTAHGTVELESDRFEKILRGELTVTGSWMSFSAPFPGSEWQGAAELLAAGKVKVDQLITHKFHLADGIKAFDTLTDKNSRAIKVMYVMD